MIRRDLILCWLAMATSVFAQQTTGQTDVFYDSGRNVIYAAASTISDYTTQYYYTAWTNTTMFNGGSYVGFDQISGSGTTYIETPATAGYEVSASSVHNITSEYQTYEVMPGCSFCYDWYDSYGYNWLRNGDDPWSQGPTWTVWVWAAPIVVVRTVSQIVVGQQSGGKLRAPGQFMDFDVAVRSFIPPSYIAGPEPFCGSSPGIAVIYNGNHRTYNRWSTEYKGHSSVTLLPDFGLSLIPVTQTGLTRRYADNAIAPDGVTLREDQVFHDCFWLDDQALSSNLNMHIDSFTPSSGGRGAHFYGDVLNPLTPPSLTPGITWDVSISINKSNPSVPSYVITGSHDCFPADEAYIGLQRIHGYTPSSYDQFTVASCLNGFGQVNILSSGTVNQ